jgi:8-oxo-dGTP pyrophosphatase MutT (NUDIX family)
MHASSGMAKFLEYQRSRLRIARATIFNLLMFLLVAVIWIARMAHVDPVLLPSVVGGGIAALILSVYAARRIDEAQMKNLVQAYAIITEGKEQMDMAQRIAAAVCYRRDENGIEFLLVRTKGGKHWTFPKGHIKVKQAEAPWQAARREAGEEAGVDGDIDHEPFARYAYIKGKNSREEMVAAFLMRVTSEREPDEPQRTPRWFPPEAAVQKLSEGRREEKYIAEHRQVIDAALARLSDAP